MDVLSLPAAGPSHAEPTDSRANFAGLDVVRAVAALGVVLLHSGVPYLRNPMPGLCWSVRDTPSTCVDCVFWLVELFIMPLFLVLAGFFAWQTLQRRGPMTLVKSRARRLLVPLLFGVIVVLPLDLYTWIVGWISEGLVSPVKLRSLKFGGDLGKDLWGLSHLWFLQYVFLYVAVVAVAVHAQRRFSSLGRFHLSRFLPSLRASVVWTLVLGSVLLYFHPEVVWGFQHAYFPVPSKWMYSGLFFLFGVMLAVHDGRLDWLRVHAHRFIASAVIVSIAAVMLGRWYLSRSHAAGESLHSNDDQLASVVLAVLTTGGAFLLTLAIIGLAVQRIRRVPMGLRYLAAASFWVYLVHHPALGLVHVDLKWLWPGVSPVVKFVSAFAVASGLSLLTYEGFVRRTALGRLLGFDWEFPGMASLEPSASVSIDFEVEDSRVKDETTGDSDGSEIGPLRKAA